MSANPTIIALRGDVRLALSAVPKKRAVPREMILRDVRDMGRNFKDKEFDEAMEWNHERNYIDYRHNHDAERREWFLTDEGRKHDE